MADERRNDEEVLADLERSLTEQDPRPARRCAPTSEEGSRHTRVLTLAWLVWSATWFITHLATSNPAALVLAAASAITYPTGLATYKAWIRQRRTKRPR